MMNNQLGMRVLFTSWIIQKIIIDHSLNKFMAYLKYHQMKMRVLTEFVESNGTIEKHGHGRIAVDEIHKIVVADIRFANINRNTTNLLLQESNNGSVHLLPRYYERFFFNHPKRQQKIFD